MLININIYYPIKDELHSVTKIYISVTKMLLKLLLKQTLDKHAFPLIVTKVTKIKRGSTSIKK